MLGSKFKADLIDSCLTYTQLCLRFYRFIPRMLYLQSVIYTALLAFQANRIGIKRNDRTEILLLLMSQNAKPILINRAFPKACVFVSRAYFVVRLGADFTLCHGKTNVESATTPGGKIRREMKAQTLGQALFIYSLSTGEKPA